MTVILSFVYISAMLLWLDLGLGAVAVVSFLPLYLLIRLYRRRAGRVYRARSTAIAAVIVKFVETMNGIRPVRAFRREAVNDAEFAVLNARHERTNGDSLLEMARYVTGSAPGGQHGGRGDRAAGRPPGGVRLTGAGRAGRRRCCICAGCTTRSTGSACS